MAPKFLVYISALVLIWCHATRIVSATVSCRGHCHVAAESMNCTGCIPESIPENVTVVKLVDIDYKTLVSGVFCHPSWKLTTQLTIMCVETCFEIGYIFDGAFQCLDNLGILQLSLHKWYIDGKKPFAGLENVFTLDLTGCLKICSSDLITILSDRTQVPHVTNLVLPGIGSQCRPSYFTLDQTMFDLVARRNISELDLSSTIIHCDPMNVTCTSLLKLNFSYADFTNSHNIENRYACGSLRILDLNGIKLSFDSLLPSVINLPSNITFIFDEKIYSPLISSVSTLNVSCLLSKNHALYFPNITVMVISKNNLKNLHLCGYNVPELDVEPHFTYNHMETVALSNNGIEVIGLNIFRNLPHLRRIDISHNKLGIRKTGHEAFSELFRKNYNLREINVANNSLQFLPPETFLSNKLLEKIDLSENKLTQISFDISHLAQLEVLDMRNNYIESLDYDSRNQLDNLYKSRKRKPLSPGNNVTLLVDLRGNRFVCNCQSLDFLKWFVDSPIFSVTGQLYHCTASGGQAVPMSPEAVAVAENDCEIPKRRRRKTILLSVLPTISVVAIGFAIIWIRKMWKKWLRLKRVKDYTKLIQQDDLPTTFLAFLSFSSEDERFVAANVLKPLKVICISIL